MTASTPKKGQQQTTKLIEIGMIMVGRLDRIDRQAIAATRERLCEWLEQKFPEFQWRIALMRREEVPLNIRQEPSALLQDGSYLRDAEGWDFALLFTSADLISRYKPYALAATSSALDLAIVSTHRVDPHSADTEVGDDIRSVTLTTSLTRLCLRSLGHLNGLANSEDERNVMYVPPSPQALTSDAAIHEKQQHEMQENLRQIADLRLEETAKASEFSNFRFYLQSAWINRHEIVNAVTHAKPWEFPGRLLRLSAAALSTLVILLITAETWHLASVQSLGKLAGLLAVALVLTTSFVIVRQRLLVQRVTFQISEQTVITNLSAALIVLLGMMTTALVLILFSLAMSWLFYPYELIAAWSEGNKQSVDWRNHWQTGMLVTTLGMMIGALGASFEDQHYFRHVVFVDEEM